ncbi:MAG: tetratricopeptide repeat protein [Candidatus Scalindua sp.]|nr:tetratricopeptide repeat protein [Candidatus Scalindua sp.]
MRRRGALNISRYGYPNPFTNDLLSKWLHRKRCLGTLAAIILPVLIVLTWKQVQYWENSNTLFKHTSNNFVIRNNLGIVLREQGRTEEAIKHYLQALRSYPDYALAHYNLSNAYAEQGKTKKVIETCKQAIRIKPDYADAHLSLGIASLSLNDRGSTLEQYKILKSLDSVLAKTLFNILKQ